MSYSIDLSGRVALVTGASSGLGTQFAKTLSRAGCAVVLAGRRVERLKTLRAEIEAGGGDAHVVELDVTDLASIKAAVAHADTEMGTIDILINNSGVSTTQKLVDVTEARRALIKAFMFRATVDAQMRDDALSRARFDAAGGPASADIFEGLARVLAMRLRFTNKELRALRS